MKIHQNWYDKIYALYIQTAGMFWFDLSWILMKMRTDRAVFNFRLPGQRKDKHQSPNICEIITTNGNFIYWAAGKLGLNDNSRPSALTCGFSIQYKVRISWTNISKEVVTCHWVLGATCFKISALSWKMGPLTWCAIPEEWRL